MKAIERATLESRLLTEREEITKNMWRAEAEEHEGQRESAGEIPRVPSSAADAGSDTQEIEKDWANIQREGQQLAQIDAALHLLRENPRAFGACERCGREIEIARLELVPWTRLCASCVREG
jgi:RNA polymerase-binding transcription factor DksA